MKTQLLLTTALLVSCGTEIPQPEAPKSAEEDTKEEVREAPDYSDSITINNNFGGGTAKSDEEEVQEEDQEPCIAPGSTKDTVLEVLGDPDSVTDSGNYRYTDNDVCAYDYAACVVKFKRGKVKSQNLVHPDLLCKGAW